jgi:hypothetical protein
MVDALRSAHRIVHPDGCVIDLHPTSDRPTVEVGGRVVGHVGSDDAPVRHAGAAIAIASAVDEGLFSVAGRERFCFHTYGESHTELADHIRTTWKSSTIDAQTLRRTRAALRSEPGASLRVTERVVATRLHPVPPQSQ